MSFLISAAVIIGKILGIVLAVLLAAAALILFVPVRYRAAGSVKNVPDPDDEEGKLSGQSLLRGARGTFDATWLLHLLHFRAFYEGAPEQAEAVPSAESRTEDPEGHIADAGAGGVELRLAGFRLPVRRRTGEEDEEEETKENKSLRERLRDLPEFIAGLPQRVQGIAQDGEGLARIASDEATAASLQKAVKAVGKLLKKLLPKRWSAGGVLGLNDPADTGSLFAVIGAAYPLFAEHLDVAAQFERPAADLTAQAEGSIRAFGVIAAAAAFWFDKNVRKTRRQWKLWRNRRTRRTTSSRQSSAH